MRQQRREAEPVVRLDYEEPVGGSDDVPREIERRRLRNERAMFGTVKAGLIGRHLTFLPAAGNTIGPDDSCTAQFFTLGRSRRGSKSSGAQLLIA